MSRTPRSRWLVHGAVGLAMGLPMAALAQSCLEYDSSLLHYLPQADSSDPDVSINPEAGEEPEPEAAAETEATEESGPDTNPEDAADAPDPTWCDKCRTPGLVRVPCPPLIADPPSAPPLVFAMKTIRFGMDSKHPTDWQTIGIDRDCLNTGADGKDIPCKRVSGADVKITQDGELGRDNSFARNVGGLVTFLQSFGLVANVEQDQNAAILAGRSGLACEIDNYGGGRNDPTVKLAFYLSRGTYDPSGTKEIPAKWDGTDLWSRDVNSLAPGDVAKYVDDAAYVIDGVLVAHLPNGLPMIFEGESTMLEMSLNEAVVSFRISDDHKEVTEGVVAGVWNSQTAQTAIQGWAEQNGICPNDPQYAPAVNSVARAPDIRLDLQPRTDLECNAISIAMAFTGAPAKLGVPIPPPTKNAGHCDAGADH